MFDGDDRKEEPTVKESVMSQAPAIDKETNRRLLSIDYFRGLAVLLMLVYDYIPFFTKDVPRVFQHGRTDMLLFGDFVAPFFLFIMGMSLAISVVRRRASGAPESIIFRQVLRRAALLFFIGLLIDETRAPLLGGSFGMKWGVLETLGASYLITYLVMRFRPAARVGIVAAALTTHMALLLAYQPYAEFISTSAHGSPLSIFAWATIAVFGMIAGERLARTRSDFEQYLYWFGGVLIIIGTVVGIINPPRKGLVSSSYALITSGGAAVTFMLLYYLVETKKVRWLIRRLRPLRELGVSALLAWILQYVLAGFFIWYYHIHEKLPLAYGLGLAVTMIAVVWLVVAFLNSRKVTLRI